MYVYTTFRLVVVLEAFYSEKWTVSTIYSCPDNMSATIDKSYSTYLNIGP